MTPALRALHHLSDVILILHTHTAGSETKAMPMFTWLYNAGLRGTPSQHPSDNNYNDSFTFIIEQTSLFVCVLAWGGLSVTKWQVFNSKNKQTTPRTCVLVYCNEGDTSTKIMLSSYEGLLRHRYQILRLIPPLVVKSNHHYCKSGNPICWYFDPLMSVRQWIYMCVQ